MIDTFKNKLGIIKMKLYNFDNIVFHEKSHTYTIPIINYTFPISGTGWIKKYHKPFDPTGHIVAAVANRERVSIQDIQDRWQRKADASCVRGNYVHEYMEQKGYGVDAIYEGDDEVLRQQADSYWNNYFKSGKYTAIAPEVVLGSLDYEVAGSGDLLAMDRNGKVVLIDYKTSKDINTYSKYGNEMLYPFNKYQECNFVKYSIQLSLYKVLLKDVADINVDTLEIVWFNKKNAEYEVITCIDFSDDIRKILKG